MPLALKVEVGGIKPMKPRPFGLIDAMLVIAAVALGLWVNRNDWHSFRYLWFGGSYERIQEVLSLVMPHLAAMTMALVAIRMRRPRPPLRRFFRSPGAVACTVATAALLVIACWAASGIAAGRVIQFSQNMTLFDNKGGHGRGGTIPDPFTGRLLVVCGDQVGFAVAGAWLSLFLAARWHPERTWIDRLGRAVGWSWLGLAVLLWARSLLL
jgi:hypothetical protein